MLLRSDSMKQPDRVAALESERLAIVKALRRGGLDDVAQALADVPRPSSVGWATAWLVAACTVQDRSERWLQLVAAGASSSGVRQANLHQLSEELTQLSRRASALMVSVNQLLTVEAS